MTRWTALVLCLALSPSSPALAESRASKEPAVLDAEMLLELDVLRDEHFATKPRAGEALEDDEWLEFDEGDDARDAMDREHERRR